MVQIAQNLHPATLIRRENRFVGQIEIEGRVEQCHILNPGRMVHFMAPGAQLLVEHCPSPTRKLHYSLRYVIQGGELILIDSIAPNRIVLEALRAQRMPEFAWARRIQPEQRYGREGKSKIDFLLDEKCYLEVKATNHLEGYVGLFPDAPSARARRHLEELIDVVQKGRMAERSIEKGAKDKKMKNNENKQREAAAAVVFVAQRARIRRIAPFDAIDPAFGRLLREAAKVGVMVIAYGVNFAEGGKKASLGVPLPVDLE